MFKTSIQLPLLDFSNEQMNSIANTPNGFAKIETALCMPTPRPLSAAMRALYIRQRTGTKYVQLVLVNSKKVRGTSISSENCSISSLNFVFVPGLILFCFHLNMIAL